MYNDAIANRDIYLDQAINLLADARAARVQAEGMLPAVEHKLRTIAEEEARRHGLWCRLPWIGSRICDRLRAAERIRRLPWENQRTIYRGLISECRVSEQLNRDAIHDALKGKSPNPGAVPPAELMTRAAQADEVLRMTEGVEGLRKE